MEQKYITVAELFGDPLCEPRMLELSARLGELSAISGRVRTLQSVRNINSRAESLAGLYLLSLMTDLSSGNYISGDGKKPRLSGGPEFNISHSRGLAVCAVDTEPLGIDAEQLRKIPDRDRLAKRYFCSEEIEMIDGAVDPDREFLRIWTKKEAYLKLTGEGLSRELCKTNVFLLDVNFSETAVTAGGKEYLITVCKNRD